MATKKSTKTVTRSSSSGKFVKTSTVKRHPSTTVTQKVRKPRKKPSSG